MSGVARPADLSRALIALIAFICISTVALGEIALMTGYLDRNAVAAHAVMEALSGGSLLAIGLVLILRSRIDSDAASYILAAGLLSMGIFDVLHSLQPLGDPFVALRTLATFVGSMCFAAVWFGRRGRVSSRSAIRIAWIITAGTVLIGLGITFFGEALLPQMISDGRFTLLPVVLNVTAGALFTLAAAHFTIDFWTRRTGVSLVLACIALLSAAVGFAFPFSTAYGEAWWQWHILSAAAAGLALVVVALEVSRASFTLKQRTDIADAIQTNLVSRSAPPAWLSVASQYRSATDSARVGGDLYDVFPISEHQVLIVVGDVSGKGVKAAGHTAFMRGAVRAAAADPAASTPSRILRLVNRGLMGVLPRGAFITAILGIYDARDRTFTFSSAGHHPPILLNQQPVPVLTTPALPLGVMDSDFSENSMRLAHGEGILLYSDGVVEARNKQGAFYSISGLSQAAAFDGPGDTTDSVVERVIQEVQRFTGGRLEDDMVLLAIRPTSEDSGRSAAATLPAG